MDPAEPSPRANQGRAALAGLLAAASTLAVAHLAAAVILPGSAPLSAVGAAFIDVTPAWLKDLAIQAFGVNDKTALMVGMLAVLGVLAAGAGILARRRPGLATGLVAVIGLGGAAAAMTRADAGVLSFVPSLAGAAVGIAVLRLLIARLPTSVREPGGSPEGDAEAAGDRVAGTSRRSFLSTAVVVTVAAVVTAAAGSVVGGLGRAATSARGLLRLPVPARPAPAVPAGAQSATPGVVDVVTANEDFYRIDTALTVPRLDPGDWTLRVHGMVDREVTLTFDELLADDLVETYVTLACVSNPIGGDLIGNARWLGLPIRDLLTRAGPQAGADMVLSTSVDGFTASTPLEVLTDGRDALLAVGMNGEPLPLAHGFPVRMVVPGLYGYVSATKWVVDLEVTRFADQKAYWTVRGWSARGPVKTSSRIEVPRAGTSVAAGTVGVGGTAWAQHVGVIGVEVQVDDGPWQPASLADEISVDTWRQWSWQWPAEPGRHTLRVRAVDATQETQTGDVAPVVPDGATGWHEVDVTVTP